MKIEWLQLILKTAETGSISKACELCHISQPAASRMIMNAEHELGCDIFKRDVRSKGLALTEDGERIIPEITRIAEIYGELLDKTGNRGKRTIRLSLSENTFSSAAAPRIISAFYSLQPEAILKIETLTLNRLFMPLMEGRSDLVLYSWGHIGEGYTSLPVSALPVSVETLGDRPECIAFAENNMPAGVENGAGIEILKDKELIMSFDIFDRSNRGANQFHLIAACEARGFSPRIRVVENASDIKQLMTLQGKGNFLSSAPDALREYPGIRFVPITDCPYTVRYYAVYKKNNTNPLIPDLIKAIKTFF